MTVISSTAIIFIVTATTGASCLSELLKINNSLQELDMRRNDISDDGMMLVADGLQCNKTLTILDVRECGISVKGTVEYKRARESSILFWSLQFLSKFSIFSQTKDLDQTDNTILFY